MRSMRWLSGLLMAGIVGVPVGNFLVETARANAGGQAPPVKLTKEEDHQRLMELLHLTEIRRGRDGSNKASPYYANYDESKANPFPDLPDPLTLKNGRKVTTASEWWNKRRPEIIEDFDREIYGRVPKVTPKVKWIVTSSTPEKNGDIDVITRKLEGVVDNSSYPDIEVKIALTLSTPANAKGPVPVVMQLQFLFGAPSAPPAAGPPYGPNAFLPPRPPMNPPARGAAPPVPRGPTGPTWQQQALARGWGYAQLIPTSIQADDGSGLTLGIIGLVNKGQPRKLDDWGALRAWAWGVSRAVDYFESDKTVDAKHIALEGHSRYGKATLVAMAYEPRLWTAYVSSSGEGGAKLNRRDWGEIVENVAGAGEYHWMAGNFIKYAGPLHWNDLPVDSHELIALCAPRPVFLSAGEAGAGDAWVDAKGTFMAGAAAGPVYRLLGKKDLGTTVFPPVETLLGDGDIAFRQHAQGHTDVPNWPFFLDFAQKHFNSN